MTQPDLFELTYRVCRELGTVKEGTATGGSTSTLIDTVGRKEADDYWLGTGDDTGTVWVLKDAGGAGAPEGEFAKVSDFVSSTSTISVTPSFSVAPAAGDRYAVSKRRFPLYILTQAVNEALKEVGAFPVTDLSLTTVAAQTEYNLPVAASWDLREVWAATLTGFANDNAWVKLYNWYVQRTATGTADKLVFKNAPPAPFTLKLVYVTQHPELLAATDKLDEAINPEYVVISGIAKALNWYRRKTRQNTQSLLDDIQRYERQAIDLHAQNRVDVPPRTGKLFIVGSSSRSYPGDRSRQ